MPFHGVMVLKLGFLSAGFVGLRCPIHNLAKGR